MKRLVFAATLAVLSIAALGSASRSPSRFTCTFKIPKVHPMQLAEPYIGTGSTELDAKKSAVRECEHDVGVFRPLVCAQFYADPANMSCVRASR